MNTHIALILPELAALSVFLLLLIADAIKGRAKSDVRSRGSFAIISMTGCVFVALVTYARRTIVDTGFHGMLSVDPMAAFFKLLFIGILFFVLPQSYTFMHKKKESPETLALIQWASLIGMFFLASANNLFFLFICIEIVTLSFYIMTSYLKHELLSIEAGLKYLIMGSLASAFMIFGIAIIYVGVGHTGFPVIASAFRSDPANRLLVTGMLLLISGVGFKIAAVPFHLWVPDVYEGAPTPTVSFLSTASKAAGFLVLIRLVTQIFPFYDYRHYLLFSVMAAATLLYGNLGALQQTSIKRLLGYSSIGHAGYLLMGIAAYQEIGLAAVIYYLCAYVVSNLAVFWIITLAHRKLHSDQIHAYQGLAKRSPFLAAVMFIALLSLAGVPPTAGFFGKFLVLLAIVQSRAVWLAFIGGAGVVISLYYYLNIVRVMYAEEPASGEKIRVSLLHKILLGILVVGILGLGTFQAPLHQTVTRIAYYLAQNPLG